MGCGLQVVGECTRKKQPATHNLQPTTNNGQLPADN
jgi:hypothetical protein